MFSKTIGKNTLTITLQPQGYYARNKNTPVVTFDLDGNKISWPFQLGYNFDGDEKAVAQLLFDYYSQVLAYAEKYSPVLYHNPIREYSYSTYYSSNLKELVSYLMTSSHVLYRERFLDTVDLSFVKDDKSFTRALFPTIPQKMEEHLDLLAVSGYEEDIKRWLRDPGQAAFMNKLAQIEFSKDHVSKDIKLKDWTEADAYPARHQESKYTRFRDLPLGTKRYRSFLDECTVEEFLKLLGKVPRSLDSTNAVDLSKSIISGTEKKSFSMSELADLNSTLVAHLAEGDKPVRELKYYQKAEAFSIYSFLVNEASDTARTFVQKLVEELKEDPSKQLSFAEFSLLYDGKITGWLSSKKAYDAVLAKLLTTKSPYRILKTLAEVVEVGESLTSKRWSSFVDQYENYGEMPASWWVPLVK